MGVSDGIGGAGDLIDFGLGDRGLGGGDPRGGGGVREPEVGCDSAGSSIGRL